MFNWINLNLSGEWSLLKRTGNINSDNIPDRQVNSTANTGFVRLGYNLNLKNGKVLEHVLMLAQFNGVTESEKQADASSINAFAGKDQSIEASLNYYFSPDLKLTLSYTFRDGDLGASEPGAGFNNYYFQSGVGSIQRGDWLGVGVVAVF